LFDHLIIAIGWKPTFRFADESIMENKEKCRSTWVKIPGRQ
jgi:hypothetical protein